MKRAKQIILLTTVLAAGALPACVPNSLRPWSVPAEAKERRNPVVADDAALAAAAPVYAQKCAQCHGVEGRGDGPEAKSYWTKPADFTDASMMDERTDGELFYKISKGRRPMPTYEKQLTEEQRWQLVHFIRGFTKKTDDKPK